MYTYIYLSLPLSNVQVTKGLCFALILLYLQCQESGWH